MTSIYLVMQGEYADRRVRAVTLSATKALAIKQSIDEVLDPVDIVEYETDVVSEF